MYISNNGVDYAASCGSSFQEYRSLATMRVEFPEDALEYHLKFDYTVGGKFMYSSIYEGFKVYMVDGDVQVGSSVPSANVTLLDWKYDINSWTNVDVILDGVAGTTKQFIFVYKTYDYSYYHNSTPAAVDNIEIFGKQCAQPTEVTASAITTSSANISWTEIGDATSWNVYYKAEDESEWSSVLATANPWTISDLSANTKYFVKVAAICGQDESSQTAQISFTTDCDAIATLPWFENLESYTSHESNPTCWKVTERPSSYNDFPKVYTGWSAAAHSGANSMEFKGGSGMILLPAFEENVHNLTLSFWSMVTSTSSQGYMEIGVVSDPDDMSTFELVATTASSAGRSAGGGTLQGPFNFMGVQAADGRMAIRLVNPSDLGMSWNIDDFTVDLLPDCTSPNANSLVVSALSSDNVTLAWADDNENNNIWKVYYKKTSDTEYQTEVVTGEKEVMLTGLDANTQYSAYVVTVCGENEESELTSGTVNFRTECEAADLPLTFTFENSSDLDCFTTAIAGKYNSRTFPEHQTASSVQHNTPGCMELMAQSSPNKIVSAFPAVTEELANVRISLWARANGSSASSAGTLEIGYMTNAADASTFVVVDTIQYIAANQYNRYIVGFNGVEEEGRIALRMTGNGTNSWYLDDITIEMVPECPSPVYNSVVVSDINSSSATVSWTDLDETHTSWIVYYKTDDVEWEDATDIEVEETSVLLDGLDANTRYTIKVATNCGEGVEAETTDPVKFKTTTEPVEFPYFNDFESPDAAAPFATSGTNQYNDWIVGSATYKANEGDETGHSFYVSNDGSSFACSTAEYSSYSYQYNYATFTVEFPEDELEYHLSFDYKVGGKYMYSNNYEGFKVYMLDGGLEVGNSVPDPHVTLLDWKNDKDWTHFDMILDDVAGTTKQIVFAYKTYYYSSYHNNTPAAVDNLSIEGYACAQPNKPTFVSADQESITLTWHENGTADTWNVYYKATGESEYSDIAANDTTFTISGLSANTVYDIYVTAMCDEESNPSPVAQMRTDCGPITALPWVEGFETMSSGTPNCWTVLQTGVASNGTFPMVWCGQSDACHNSQNSVEFKAGQGLIVLPEFEEDFHNLRVSFWSTATSSSNQGVLEVGIITDMEDTTSFISVGQAITSSTRNGVGTFQGFFTFMGVEATEGRIALRYTNPSNTGLSWNLDDFTVETLPECTAPLANSLAVSDLTSTSVTLTWVDENENNADWRVYYKKHSLDNYTQYVDASGEPTVTITDLEPNTKYDAYVLTLCGEQQSQDHSNVVTFRTECDIVTTLPLTYDFESSDDANCFAVPVRPNNNYPVVQMSSTIAHNGSNGAYEFRDGSAVVAFPQISEPLSNLRMKVWGMNNEWSGHAYSNPLEIGYMTNAADTSTFVVVDTMALGVDDTYGYYLFSFQGVEAEDGARIAIRYNCHPSGTLNSWYIDDVTIELIPDCPSPVNSSLAATNVTDNSATISWTDLVETHTAWDVHYKTADAEEWTNVAATENTVVLTDLQSNTKYTVAVSAQCNGEAEWTLPITFKTTTTPVSFPYFNDFEGENADSPFAITGNDQYNRWIVGTAAFKAEGTETSGHSLYVSQNNTTDYYAACPSSYNSSMSYDLATFAVNFPDSALEYHLAFDYKVGGNSSYEGFRVYLLDGGVDAGNGIPADGVALCPWQYQKFDWQHMDLVLEDVAGQSKQIVFLYKKYEYYFYHETTPPAVDNLELYGNACARPNHLVKQEATDNTLTIKWHENGNASQWIVYYKQHSEEDYDSYVANDTISVLDGLDANTEYDVYVVAVCGDDEVSNASDVVKMRTECGAITSLPWTEGFESYTGSGSAVQAECWQGISTYTANNGTFPGVYPGYKRAAYEGNNSMEFKGGNNLIVLPIFEEDFHNLRVSFYANTTSTSQPGTMELGILTDLSDPSSFESVATFTNPGPRGSSDNVNATGSVYMMADLVDAQATEGRIALRYTNTNSSVSWNVDNFTVTLTPACLAPNTPVVSNVTSTTADVQWVDNNPNHTAWQVFYKQTTETQYQMLEANSNAITLTGLEPITSYQLYVKTYCGEEENLEQTATVSFTTKCGAISDFPYSEGFENGFGCWTSEPVEGAYNWTIASSSLNANSGTKSASFPYESAGSSARLISPELNLTTITEPTLTYNYKLKDYDYAADKLQVYYRTSVEAEWTLLATHDTYTTAYVENTINLVNPTATYQVMFLGTTMDGDGILLDDVVIDGNCIPTTSSETATICEGSAYNFGGNVYTTAGEYTYTTTNANGCEHVITLTLTVNPTYADTLEVAVEYGETYTFEGQTYDASGVYTAVYQTENNCDSTKTLILTVGEEAPCVPTTVTINEAICEGASYTFGGNTYTTAGQYTYVTTNVAGCDSTITLNLTVNPVSTTAVDTTVCATALPFTWNGQNVDGAGAYTYTTTNAAGCDSTVTLNVVVNATSTAAVDTSVCATALPFTWNGINVTAAGEVTYTTTNAAGCDSTVTLNVVVNAISTAAVDTAVCATALPFTWNGINVTAAGEVTYTTTNAAGCDSVVTLNVTLLEATSEAQDTIVCPTEFPFTWNGQNVTGAGEVTYTTTNEAGCEHVITLTVNVYEQTARDNDTVILRDADLPYTHESGLVCEEYMTYEINAVDENGCAYSYNLVVLHDAGLMDAEANMSVALYPNPTSGNATLSIEGLTEDATILVTDVQGRVISTSVLTAGETTSTIETNTLPAGVYYVRVVTSNSVSTSKLIKK